MIFNLSEQNSIAHHFLAELRDKTIQKDRMRFRKNMERLGEIMAYEISKNLPYATKPVESVLGVSHIPQLIKQPLLLTILRAGLPFAQGFLNFFDNADIGFIGAYRMESKQDVKIKLDYVSVPDVQNAELVVIDPMLATGRSIIDSLNLVLQKGTPKYMHIVSLIAAPEGIQLIQNSIETPYSFWTCAVDEKLNELFYIVPGLGDAGDLSFGAKL